MQQSHEGNSKDDDDDDYGDNVADGDGDYDLRTRLQCWHTAESSYHDVVSDAYDNDDSDAQSQIWRRRCTIPKMMI